jgi:phage tail sheath protein FI
MSSALSYPGVYIEEIPSGVRTITGVATSITVFIGRALRGPVDMPVRVQSFGEYSRIFGDIWQPSALGYSVNQFFQHGGRDALIVRVFNGDKVANSATLTLDTGGGSDDLVLEAASPGAWGNRLKVTVDHVTRDPADTLLFNLLIQELDRPGGTNVVSSELIRNVSVDSLNPRFVNTVLNEESVLVNVRLNSPPKKSPKKSPTDGTAVVKVGSLGSDGNDITNAEIIGDSNKRTGIYALDGADLFNLLCIPPLTRDTDVADTTWKTAAIYCQSRRAMLIVDPPKQWTADQSGAIGKAHAGVNTLRGVVTTEFAINAMIYFPRLRQPDPLSENRLDDFAPSGAVAGIIARTDLQRGVWKAPAGLAASFAGTQGFTYTMTDVQNGDLNPNGLNCLRSFPVAGHLVWGARTLAGADLLASEWKYIPVRRLALYIEESLCRGTQWVVFEPNDEPLWAQIRLNIGSFMHDLFRQSAFQGASPRDAYFVKCDRETTTQSDINRGVVNILVGFAPLKPAEFVVIKLQQMSGQIVA